jgi:hypothetical protein
LHEIGKGAAFLIRELLAIGRGIESRCSPVGRQPAEFSDAAGNGAATVNGQAAELVHGSTDLHTLLLSEVLHRLIGIKNSLSLLRRHLVELLQATHHALLDFGRRLAETGFLPERIELLLDVEMAAAAHPFWEVLLPPDVGTLLRP